jgi:hypothetical protein
VVLIIWVIFPSKFTFQKKALTSLMPMSADSFIIFSLSMKSGSHLIMPMISWMLLIIFKRDSGMEIL